MRTTFEVAYTRLSKIQCSLNGKGAIVQIIGMESTVHKPLTCAKVVAIWPFVAMEHVPWIPMAIGNVHVLKDGTKIAMEDVLWM